MYMARCVFIHPLIDTSVVFTLTSVYTAAVNMGAQIPLGAPAFDSFSVLYFSVWLLLSPNSPLSTPK